MKPNSTRFCTYCWKFGHMVKFCWSINRKKLNEQNAPRQPKETYSQNYPNQSKSPNNYRPKTNDRSNARRGRRDSPSVAKCNRTRSNSYSGTVRFEARPDKVNSLYDTLKSCNPLNKSSLGTKKVRIQMTLLTHLELECPANNFLMVFSNTPSETQIKIIALALSFWLILAQLAPLSPVIHSQRLKNFNH